MFGRVDSTLNLIDGLLADHNSAPTPEDRRAGSCKLDPDATHRELLVYPAERLATAEALATISSSNGR